MEDFIGVVILFGVAAGIMFIIDLFRKDSLEKEKRAKQELETAAAFQTQQIEIEAQTRINALQEKYGESVSYYYNNAFVDRNGVYIQTNILGMIAKKKYFTLAELDYLLENFKNLKLTI